MEQERQRRQLSKAELASIAGLQPAAVRRLLTAETPNPTLRTVISVAEALGFEVELKPKSSGKLVAQQSGAGLAEPAVLDEIARRLVAELRPERIYLFGSRARGNPRPDSDYDVLVVVRERTGEGYAMEQRAYHALVGVGVPVEVVVMVSEYFHWMLGAAASLPSEVQREGRLLYAA